MRTGKLISNYANAFRPQFPWNFSEIFEKLFRHLRLKKAIFTIFR